MELRKVEQELDKLSFEWKALRRKRPRFDGADAHVVSSDEGEALSTRMPSWKELKSNVNDDEIFPPEEEENDVQMEDKGADAIKNEIGTETDATNKTDTGDGDTAAAGYSEFGMCLAPSAIDEKTAESAEGNGASKKNGGSVFERYAAKSKVTKPEKKAVSQEQTKDGNESEDDEQMMIVEEASFKDALSRLESLHERFKSLGPKIDKFMTKLKDRDPVTKKPRYGAKTLPRVKSVIRTYKALEHGVSIIFHDTDVSPSLISSIRTQIQEHTEQINDKVKAQQSQEQLEAERVAKERLIAEEHANQQRLLEEQRKRNEERELARLAEEARKRRVEEEQCALEAERQTDQELLVLVPTIGADGVREQIGRMREALKDDRAALGTALGSLYTLFEQIVRKPEETNFRRVRRDHPKFMEDIGRHIGGREVLIAAGFKLEKLDGVPSFFSKEPHIESDMDGWSNWFDGLKKTLEVIEEEMMK